MRTKIKKEKIQCSINSKKIIRYLYIGPGENAGVFYKNLPAIIIERDSYYRDYLVRFKNGTEDWIKPQYLRNPYERKNKKSKNR